MTYSDDTEVHGRTLTAFFDTRAAADRAVSDLVAAGIPRKHIELLGGNSAAGATGLASDDKGFWDSLKDFFMPDEDRYAYAEGLRRGGYLVSVRADEANYRRVIDLLDREGSVDMDQRETAWRSEGWTGYQAAAGSGAGSYPAPRTGLGTASTSTTATGTSAAARSLGAGQEEVIPVYEEQIRVGKRDVSHGRVRLRSYVVETPVSEQVSLHSERVEVERHPTDRAVAAGDAVFQDRVIEAEERDEEAVVQKNVRVKEEIGLRKVAEDRTQTVSDKVRRTEVEIEDERGTVVGGTKSGTASGRTPDRKI